MRHLFRKEPPYVTLQGEVRARGKGGAAASDDGLWVRCENERCRELLYAREFEKNLKVCHKCEHHARLSARERIAQLVDDGTAVELDAELAPSDPLGFAAPDQVYRDKLRENAERTGERDAAVSVSGLLLDWPVEIVALDMRFIGGSMASVVGEKIARAADRARDARSALITVSASGGARQQEGIFALMQMAKTVSALAQLGAAGVLYVAILADPTLAGVLASFAGVGDITIAEQGAVAGFAGRRVIEQTTKQKLPPNAQTAEFLQEHGMVDLVLHRRELRPTLGRLLRLYRPRTEQTSQNGVVAHAG